jgi:hypothetical protein
MPLQWEGCRNMCRASRERVRLEPRGMIDVELIEELDMLVERSQRTKKKVLVFRSLVVVVDFLDPLV